MPQQTAVLDAKVSTVALLGTRYTMEKTSTADGLSVMA